MSLDSLANCPRCDRLFVKGPRKVCHDCYKAIEKEYEKVYMFIRNKENRKSTIKEVSEATEVSERQISDFIREGRISVADFPNLAMLCDVCGENFVSQGNMCDSCRNRLTKEIKQTFEDERKKHEEKTAKHVGYYQVKDRFTKED